MIYLDNRRSVFKLDTFFRTTVYRNFNIIDPATIETIVGDDMVKREHFEFSYRTIDLNTPHVDFIRMIASYFLDMFNYNHKKDKWYMDVIRYNLDNDKKPIDSGLAWHCENDNYPNLITVMIYPRIDDDIVNGSLGYIDTNNVKQNITIDSGTIIVMDGNVYHKPDDPYGSGKRDLIAVSFEKYTF